MTWTIPAAVPHDGATHQAEENRLSNTSGLNNVTLRWTCRRFNTRAKNTPTVKSRPPRRDIWQKDCDMMVDALECPDGNCNLNKLTIT